jgi:alpha-galactosidase
MSIVRTTHIALVILALIACSNALGQTAQPITETEEAGAKVWKIQTARSLYEIGVASDGIVVPLYYGPKGGPPSVPMDRLKVSAKIGSTMREVPFRGGLGEQLPAIEVVYPDGVRDADLVYNSSSIIQIDGQPSLQIDLNDAKYGLKVTAYYRVLPDLDLIERWIVLRNEGDKPIALENALSASCQLPAGEYELMHLTGDWAREFMPRTTRLTPGVKTLQSRNFQSFTAPPWIAVYSAGAGENHGNVFFASLHYSGNWRLDIAQSFPGDVQISGGINFWDTSLQLKPGETFTTPRMVIGFSPDGIQGASQRMHEYVRRDVLPASFRNRRRPVIYNSWCATAFNVQEQQQVVLAKIAKQIGVELFVVDDGWFKGRNDDHAGLGDWIADPKKFPNGLSPMIKQINDLGMDFGIWVEPEMVNPDSDLYRAHPDWVFNFPTRTRHEQRNQLMLNLARQDVYDYLLDAMTKLLSQNNIKFIKWDRNRGLSEPGWPDASPEQQRAVRILYMQNLYKLIDTLRARFPEVMFEDCSGGGGRSDLGMLERTDQIWPSDNTIPTDRLYIQSGFLRMFPPNTMVSWVTDDNWHHAAVSTRYRFAVSMAGVLGVGGDITKWSEADRDTAKKMIALYKEIRPIIQQGTVYQLMLPTASERVALEYLSPDRQQGVLLLYTMRDPLAGSTDAERNTRVVRLHGLDLNASYSIKNDMADGPEQILSGRTLMDVGIPWPLFADYDCAILRLQKK